MTTVLCLGCFDVLHYGHLRHLKAARALGDRLVVSVTADQNVNKGPGRPVFTHNERAEMLMALRIVDAVIVSRFPEEAINEIQPRIYCKGKEYEGRLPEQALVESYGGRVIFTDEPVYSSTALLKVLA